MLLNLSNHPSAQWSDKQLKAAIADYHTVMDLPFPEIPPDLQHDDLNGLVNRYYHEILVLKPDAVHVMGELTFTHRLVKLLMAHGIKCLASTTQRISREDKKGTKTSTFNFVQFREY